MLFNVLNKYLGSGGYAFLTMTISVLVGFVCLKYFKNLLPKDQGRAFAVNGELSEGKPRGAGIIFITVFVVCVALFVPVDKFMLCYVAGIYGAMLTGYLDDAADKPWGNLKKGLWDLVISVGLAFTVYFHVGSRIAVTLAGKFVDIPAPLYIFLAAVLIWTAINVTNCSDGVDGLCVSLVLTVLFFHIYVNLFDAAMASAIRIMAGILIAYLWYNCSPSKMLMGDAGSRALGVFLALTFLIEGRPLWFIPFALVIILDGGLGLLKLSFRRFLKMKNFMEGIRTPLHDHARKNKGWSDTQVVTRFVLLQVIITVAYFGLINAIHH